MDINETTVTINAEDISKYGDAINHAGWSPTGDNQWYTTGFKEVHCNVPSDRGKDMKAYTTALVMTHDGITETMNVIIGLNGDDTTLVLMNQERPEETAVECFNGDDRASRVGSYVYDKVLENIAGRK